MKNITVKELFENPTADYLILEGVKPKNYFIGKTMNINSMPYTNVKHCFKLLQKEIDEKVIANLFNICYDVTPELFYIAPVVEFYQANGYMMQSLVAAANNEAKLFTQQSEDDHLWKMAGADRLKPFSDIMPLIQLGKDLGQYPFDLGRKPYGEIINLLAANKVQNEVSNEFLKIKK